MFTTKNISFGNIKERVQNAQQGLSDGWKNIADKAKKEVKIVNKIARKALATEDGGKLRDSYVVTVDLDAGYNLFKGFQDNWIQLHHDSVKNVKKAEIVDQHIYNVSREWQKYEGFLEEFHGNLIVLPEVIAKVEIIQKRIDAIGKQTRKIEDLLVEYEDVCECYQLERSKIDMRVKLSQLIETKHAEYTLKKSLATDGDEESKNTVLKELSEKKIACYTHAVNKSTEMSESVDKQQAYTDAFLDQMNKYIQYGEIEKPISGSLAEKEAVTVEDIQIDESDLSTLREFLGPEEINSVIQAQASQNKLLLNSSTDDDLNTESENVSKVEYTIITDEENLLPSLTGTSSDNNITGNENISATISTSEDVDDNSDKTLPGIESSDSTCSDNVPIKLEDDGVLPRLDNEHSIDKQMEGSDDENDFFDASSN